MQILQINSFLQGGKYRIEKVLGQGGFGITYLATQELLDRKVCIKEFFFKDSCSRNAGGEVTLGTVGNRDLVGRFLNKFIKEARTLSQLDHSNIIRVLDIFKENNTAYYVMDFIEGSSLEDIVNSKGILSESHAIDYIKQIANALDYIHQRSINHLDVKPANIMVRRSDNKAILIDFGVSKQYDSTGEQTSTTPVGISYGYAPIEQYRPGGVSEFSPQADIYALGATLYKLVTGKIPPQAIEIFNEGSLILPNSLSSNISNAIQNAMQLKKSDRPKSAKEFLNTLNVSNINQKASSFTASKSIVSESMVQTSSITNSCKERFVKIVVDVLGVNPKDVIEKASIRNDLGADSLDAMDIIIRVEGEFGILINDDEFDDITVGDAISFLEKATLKKSNSPLSIKEFLKTLNGSEKSQKSSSSVVSRPSTNDSTILIKPTQPPKLINGHEYVDLGLPSGLKWATCNVGANKPEECGELFSWGEVNVKEKRTEENYEYGRFVYKGGFLGIGGTRWLHNDDIGSNISGTQYDVARVKWGGSWRMPSKEEIEELINNSKICLGSCQNGVNGTKIISKINGNSIFFPNNVYTEGSERGDGYYWSSTPHYSRTNYSAYGLLFYYVGHKISTYGRCGGQGVRPVSN